MNFFRKLFRVWFKRIDWVKIYFSFSKKEKRIFFLLIILVLFSFFLFLRSVYLTTTEVVPVEGGEIKVGVLGLPRFINPVYAESEPDKILTQLIYAGLLRKNQEGNLVQDLAKSYEVKNNNLTHTLLLKDKIYFHDGHPLTAEDVVYTVSLIQNENKKSGLALAWEGIKVVAKSDKIVEFTLPRAYPEFEKNLSLGILPKHLWEKIPKEEILSAAENQKLIVGAGPYRFEKITYQDELPSSASLTLFGKAGGQKGYLKKINFYFSQKETDLAKDLAEKKLEVATGFSLNFLREEENSLKTDQKKTPLPHLFSVFLNQKNAPILKEKSVREALYFSLNKEELAESLNQAIWPTNSIFPPHLSVGQSENLFNLEKAKKILSEAGWTINELSGIYERRDKKKTDLLAFSLATSNEPELKSVAEIIVRQWRALGAEVTLKVFEPGDLRQNVIRLREYEALLSGQVIEEPSVLFAFWHSSQQIDPGVNIALYSKASVDQALEALRTEGDQKKQQELLEHLEKTILSDLPILPLYLPYFVLAHGEKINLSPIKNIIKSEDYAAQILTWYKETDRLLKIFNN